jgi:hypothetical protein
MPRFRAAYFSLCIFSLVAAIYLCLAAVARPREYSGEFYFWLRVVVCVWASAAMLGAWGRWRNASFLPFLGAAVVFNPIRPFYLSKGIWSVVDIGVMLLCGWVLLWSSRCVRELPVLPRSES